MVNSILLGFLYIFLGEDRWCSQYSIKDIAFVHHYPDGMTFVSIAVLAVRRQTTWFFDSWIEKVCMSVLILSMPAWPLYMGAKTWIFEQGFDCEGDRSICSIIFRDVFASRLRNKSGQLFCEILRKLALATSSCQETMVESSLCTENMFEFSQSEGCLGSARDQPRPN